MKRSTATINFGKKLSDIRRAKGLTQKVLGEKIGVSQRVIAYYEGETDFPPAHLLIPIAKALKVSTDELLGVKNIKEQNNPEHAALWRKLRKISDLPKKDQKILIDTLEVLIAKQNLRKSA